MPLGASKASTSSRAFGFGVARGYRSMQHVVVQQGGLAPSGEHRVLVVSVEPEARMPTEGIGPVVIPPSDRFPFHFVGIQRGIEVEVHSEDVSGGVIRAPHGGELHVSLVFALGPIDDVDLAVHADVKPADCQALQQALFAFSNEGEALLVKEMEFAIESAGGDPRDLAHPAKGFLVHQQLEDESVLMGLLLPHRSEAHGKGLSAGLASVALRAAFGLAEGLILRTALLERRVVILAGWVGAGDCRW